MTIAQSVLQKDHVRELVERYSRDLANTERMSLRDLKHYQERSLVWLVRHARNQLPFYRSRLDALFKADGQIDLSRWNEVPILRRDQVSAYGREMRVSHLPAIYGAIREWRTSGTSGEPLEIASNDLVLLTSNLLFTRMVRWFGLDNSRPLATIRRFINNPVPAGPEGRVSIGWSLAKPGAPLYEMDIMEPVEQQLEWLLRHKAPYLMTQPSGALAIAHAVTPESGRALGIEFVILVGETIPDGARDFIAERLGARVAGVYACQEIGAIACECEVVPHYHIAAENALVEILDERERDVAPSEHGRVVVTGFFNYAMPFIRYDLGDIAQAGPAACPCGRAMPVITRIVGRTRNAFVFRDGARLWLRDAMVQPMNAFVPFRRYQLVQLDHERIEFRYIPDGSGRDPDLVGLNTYARTVLHPSIQMSIREMEVFPRGPSGKVDEFISQIPAG
jgi:phenylacetate-CoA ligase